jgi:hypothetical protein
MNVVLSRHGSHNQSIVFLVNADEFTHLIQVNQVIGHGKAKIHHRHQRLSASENFVILEGRDHLEGFTQIGGTVVLKASWFHGSSQVQAGRLKEGWRIHQASTTTD